jgi:alpha-L-fucosidase
MRKTLLPSLLAAACLIPAAGAFRVTAETALPKETPAEHNARMAWWRNARFGMFIHWGLYAVPAGEWQGKTNYAEWIRHQAHIPVQVYEKFLKEFNPTNFDARAWARLAREAGMKYLVITSKHHDGFCNWPSRYTDWDIESTPFKRDILGELAAACRAEGIKFGLYYSIMDWHHPDYLPRRSWEEKDRPADGADMDRYVQYMKNQLAELVHRYHPAVLWFDGEWESTWNHERGKDLYQYVRGLDPNIIINNRVDKGRSGMAGLTKEGEYLGDFGTPEQNIPAQGLPGVDWETCMTMNRHWGYNKHDKDFKSAPDLIRKLVDISSKGGNFLLNVGPRADGTFPPESVKILKQMGQWMRVNGEAIYGTQASPLKETPWGRCTRKVLPDGNLRLYLEVFDWPKDGKLLVDGLCNQPLKAGLLDGKRPLPVSDHNYRITIELPKQMPDPVATVIALDLKGAEVVTVNPYENETPAERDARMAWWRKARFGMFIHWGVYSVPAGTYEGKRIPGIGEWIMYQAKIPVAKYKQFAKRFNPVKYDPDEWVRLAKEAGMKYIVITSKHHDGFALFDSKVTDWDVVDATPYGKDLLKPLAEACRRHGIRLGFYYSQAQDWNHPGGGVCGKHWDPAQDGSMDDYIAQIAVPQVREILSNYGKISVLWWDTPCGMNRERANQLLPLIRLQPGIIINNRLGGGYHGDTETPEQHIPATGIPGRDWETCMTMNNTWGYKSYDNNWKSTETLVRNLVDIASKGGNYLLNVGPTSEGLIPEASVQRLKEVGQWMRVNGEAIYDTTASPFERLPWGRCTKRVRGNDITLYLHVFDWPADGKLLVPGLRTPVQAATLLATGKKLSVLPCAAGMLVAVPPEAPDAISSTVVLKVRGPLKIETPPLAQASDGTVTLPASRAKLHGSGLRYEKGGGKDNIGFWTNPGEWVEWPFQLDRAGEYEVIAEIASPDASRIKVRVGGQQLVHATPATGSYTQFKPVPLGTVKLATPGRVVVAVHPVKKNWRPINLKSIRLAPVKK